MAVHHNQDEHSYKALGFGLWSTPCSACGIIDCVVHEHLAAHKISCISRLTHDCVWIAQTSAPLLLVAASTFGNKEPYELVDPGLCKDYDPRCAEWAKSGECKNNPKFMVSHL